MVNAGKTVIAVELCRDQQFTRMFLAPSIADGVRTGRIKKIDDYIEDPEKIKALKDSGIVLGKFNGTVRKIAHKYGNKPFLQSCDDLCNRSKRK